MDLKADKKIKEGLEGVNRMMTEYMNDSEVEYSQKDIDKCSGILDTYLAEMGNAENKTAGLEVVKRTVIALNNLNESCGHEIIETMEREEICEVIIRASELKGFSSDDDDVTEEWREW